MNHHSDVTLGCDKGQSASAEDVWRKRERPPAERRRRRSGFWALEGYREVVESKEVSTDTVRSEPRSVLPNS